MSAPTALVRNSGKQSALMPARNPLQRLQPTSERLTLVKDRAPDPRWICHICKKPLHNICADDYAVCYAPQGTRFYLCRAWTPQACEVKWHDFYYQIRLRNGGTIPPPGERK